MNYLKNQQGLTLVETVVALVLILLLVTAFAGAMTVGLQREVEVDISLKASSLASSVFEHLGDNRVKIEIIEEDYDNKISLLKFYNLIDI